MKKLKVKVLSIVLTIALVIGYALPGVNIVNAESINTLPNGFTNVAIGNNDNTGNANFNKESGLLTVEGSGAQIGKDKGVKDSYQFVSYKVNGDSTIIARLVDFDMSQANYG